MVDQATDRANNGMKESGRPCCAANVIDKIRVAQGRDTTELNQGYKKP